MSSDPERHMVDASWTAQRMHIK